MASSLALNPLSLVSATPQLISLLYRTPKKVTLGKDASKLDETDGGGRNNTRLGIITFDAIVSEVHTLKAQVTSHPVEEGFNVTDNIRTLPEELQIDGIVSRHPIKFLSSIRIQKDPVDAAYKTLLGIVNKSTLVDVVTSLDVYTSMAINSVTISRDADTGNVLSASIGLTKVRTIRAKYGDIATPRDDPNRSQTDGGTVSVRDAPRFEADSIRGLLPKIFEQLKGSLSELFGSAIGSGGGA